MVNKKSVTLSITHAIIMGIRAHFKSAKITGELPDLGIIKVEVLGLTFEIQVSLIDTPENNKQD